MKGRRLCQAGWAEGSSGIVGWQTVGEDKGRVQTLLEGRRKMTLAECLGDKWQKGLEQQVLEASSSLSSTLG